MKPHSVRIALAAAAALAATLALSGCAPAHSANAAAPAAAQVSVITVHPTRVPLSVELPARTSPYLVAQIRARIDGIVRQREFTEGSDVKAGQRLYQIDPAPCVAALNSAKAALQKAEANLASTTALVQRDKVLVDANAVSRQDWDNAVAAQGQAQADVGTAKAMVATAQINLDYTSVTSPIAGRSGPSLVTQGAYVQANAATLLTTVQQVDPIYVEITQPSVAGLQLRRDMASGQLKADGAGPAKVSLTLEDGSPYPVAGTLQFSDITVNPTTGSVTMRAVFPNPHFALLPGMFVRARIEQGVLDNVMLVPEIAVTHNPQGQATALVVGADNRIAQRTLQLKGTRGDQWIVEGGLADGDRVVVSGLQKVQPGSLVQIAAAGA
jgi:membrane fusion protein (multidrug efflux system)